MVLSNTRVARLTRHRAYLLMLLALVLLNTWIGLRVKRYVTLPGSTDTIQVPQTSDGWSLLARPGDVDFSEMGITLHNSSDEALLATYEFALPPVQSATGYLQVSANIQVARGDGGGEHATALQSMPHAGTAALAFWFLDVNGGRLGFRNIYYMPGRYYRTKAVVVLRRPTEAVRGVYALVSRPGAADFMAANGRVDSVQPNRYFKPVLTGLIVLHGLVLAMMLCQAARHTRITLLIKPALLLLIIAAGVISSLPGLRLVVLPVAAQIAQVSELEVSQVLGFLLKSGHAALYMVLTLALAPVRRALQIAPLHYALFLLIMAAGSESLQLFVIDRQAALTDIGIDASGILLGLLILSLWHRMLNQHTD